MKTVNKRKKSNQTWVIVWLSVAFYVILIATTLVFSKWLIYEFKSDWALIIVAAIPLLIALVIFLVRNASSLRAKFGDFELEFKRVIASPDSANFLYLDHEVLNESVLGGLSGLEQTLAEIKTKPFPPNSLVVPVSRNYQEAVDFFALRQSIYEISRIAPLEFIVFVDDDRRYLGFSTVNTFKSNYPLYGTELLIDDVRKDEAFAEGFFRINREMSIDEMWRDFRNYYLRKYWDPNLERNQIRTQRDLNKLGAIKLCLLDHTDLLDAYTTIKDAQLEGLPIVDGELKFIGVVTKTKIEEEVIKQLLSQADRN